MYIIISMRASIPVSALVLWLHVAPGFAFHPLARCQQRAGGRFGTRTMRSPLLISGMSIGDDENDAINGSEVNGLTERPVDPVAMDRPSKSDLYSQDELFSILQIHQSLQTSLPTAPPQTEETPISPSLHDMIMQAVADIEDDDANNKETPVTFNYSVNQKIRDAIPNIRAIASDVDGTLISVEHSFHPRTREAVKRAVEAASSPTEPLQYFFPATGKSRAGALASMGTEIGNLLSKVPGVFCQGLYCVDAQGNVIYERKLTREQVDAVEQLAQHYGVSLIAYDGDNLFASKSSDPKHLVDVVEKWGEPRPTVLDVVADYEPGFHKVVLMDDDAQKIISVVRPPLEGLASAYEAEVTQAIPNIVEFLPKGCSKAVGVQELCKALGIDPSTQLLAMGDAENDIGMLQLAAIGVAMGNALPMVMGAADLVVRETNDEGGAGVAIEQFGFGQALEE